MISFILNTFFPSSARFQYHFGGCGQFIKYAKLLVLTFSLMETEVLFWFLSSKAENIEKKKQNTLKDRCFFFGTMEQ